MRTKIFKIAALSMAIAFGGMLTPAQGAAPAGYYDSLEGLSGVSLKKAVKKIVSKHTAISYGDETWAVFKESDTHYVGNQLCWWDMYSPDNVSATNGHSGLNIEHSVANSWWGGTKNDAYKDIHHLNPSNSDANSRKSNYPLGEIKTQTWSNGVTFVGKPASGDCGGATYVYEPADMYKGDFARVFFYMFTTYDDISWTSQWSWMYDKSSDLTLKPWAYNLLLKWSAADPVSEKETNRNDVVYKHQKNRNPFIDLPHLAEHIWGSKQNQPFHLDGTVDPDDPDPDQPDQPDDPVSPGPDNPEIGHGIWYAVTSAQHLNEKDRYIIVSVDNSMVMSYELGSSNKFFQPCSGAPQFGTSKETITDIPSKTAILSLKAANGGYTVAISDSQGAHIGYLNSTGEKTATVSKTENETGNTVKISTNSTTTDFTYTYSNNKEYTLQYNASAPRFTTYNSKQEAIRLYRMEIEETSGLGTGLEENASETITAIYDINGRPMNARSIEELDHGIYIVVSNFGVKKIMK